MVPLGMPLLWMSGGEAAACEAFAGGCACDDIGGPVVSRLLLPLLVKPLQDKSVYVDSTAYYNSHKHQHASSRPMITCAISENTTLRQIKTHGPFITHVGW